MSIGGRSRIWSRTTVSDFPTRGAANAPIPTGICETFPNDGLLASTPQDQPWNAFVDGFISGGVLTGPSFADGRMEVDAGSDDMFVQADMSAGTTYLYLLARCGDNVEMYSDLGVYLYVDDFAGIYLEIGDWSGGGAIAFDTPAGAAFPGTWRLECSGDTARALLNGVEMLTADISGVTTTGQRGAFEFASDSHFDFHTVTLNESFNKANSTVIGPDLSPWSKESIVNGGAYTDDLVVWSNELALQGHDGMFGGAEDGYAQGTASTDQIVEAEFQSIGYDAYMEVELTAQSVVGSGDHFTRIELAFRSGGQYAATFRNEPFITPTFPAGGQFVTLNGFGNTTVPTSFAAGDVLRLEHDDTANLLRAKINGVQIASVTANLSGVLEPRVTMEVGSGSIMVPFTWAHQDRVDNFETSGTWRETVYDGTMDNFCVGAL